VEVISLLKLVAANVLFPFPAQILQQWQSGNLRNVAFQEGRKEQRDDHWS
jgi:hypothetical protein